MSPCSSRPSRRVARLAPLDEELTTIVDAHPTLGGMLVHYEQLARLRFERDRLAESLREALEKIQATGCVVKDLDMACSTFPR